MKSSTRDEGSLPVPTTSSGFPPPLSRWASSFSPFQSITFRNLWLASLVSNIGGQMQVVATAWLVVSITSSATMTALVQTASMAPLLALSLVSGALADSLDRRTVMLAAQALMLAASFVLTILTGLRLAEPWILIGLTAVVGCGSALNAPAWQTSVREHVPAQHLGSAIALNSLQVNIARTSGPLLGGALLAAAGATAVFAFNSLSYIWLMLLLGRWRPAHAPARSRTGVLQGVLQGCGHVSQSRELRGLMVRGLCIGMCGSAVWALAPVLALGTFGGGSETYGALMAAFGAGAIVGATFITAIRPTIGDSLSYRIGLGGLCICLGALATTSHIATAAAAMLGFGACWLVAVGTLSISVQLVTAAGFVGRATSMFQMATFGGVALGSWIAGLAADNWDVRFTLALSSGALGTVFFLLGSWPVQRPTALQNEKII